MSQFNKAWAALSALILLVVGTELGTDSKWYTYAVAALGVIAVYFVRNKPKSDADNVKQADIQGP